MKSYSELKAEWAAATAGFSAQDRVNLLLRHGLKLEPKTTQGEKVFKITVSQARLLGTISLSDQLPSSGSIYHEKWPVESRTVIEDEAIIASAPPGANSNDLALAA